MATHSPTPPHTPGNPPTPDKMPAFLALVIGGAAIFTILFSIVKFTNAKYASHTEGGTAVQSTK